MFDPVVFWVAVDLLNADVRPCYFWAAVDLLNPEKICE
jgi:hypothetical protein